MKIHIYCRVSKSNGKFGLDTNSNVQIDECKNYCINQGWKEDDIIFYNEEKSGRKGCNISSLKHILDKMKSDDILVIHTIDRLSRNVLEGVKFLEDLNSKGCRIISVVERATYDKDDIYGRYKFRDSINHAELESDRTSQRITRTFKNKQTSQNSHTSHTTSSTRFQCKKRKISETQNDNIKTKKTKTVKNKKENNFKLPTKIIFKIQKKSNKNKINNDHIVSITTNRQNNNYFLRSALEKYNSNN